MYCNFIKQKNNSIKFFSLIYISILFLFLLTACSKENEFVSTTLEGNQTLSVHFIDVGQGDSILVESNGEYMLIDAGSNEEGKVVLDYLKNQGVKKLNYIIGTHPHEDHIGGLDDVINNFSVGKVFLTDYVEPTVTFENLLLAIKNKKLKIINPGIGDEYPIGSGTFTFIAPINKDYGDNVNNYSLGIKLTNGENTYILAGDAEKESEEDMVKSGIDLTADVLKINHHGSMTSSVESFIEAVDPTYAIISLGKDNPYGHPSSSVVTRLQDEDIQIYRTDLAGTIIVTSDGKNLTIKTLGAENKQNETKTGKDDKKEDELVYVTQTGTKYHVDGCQYLNDSKIPLSLVEAKLEGYLPCDKCNPPE